MTNQIDINGFCAAGYESFRDHFKANFDEGREVGASLHLTLEGETVVDLWGGHTDNERTNPWERDALTCVYSTTKIPVVVCLLMVIDRGLIELDAPIATYWPEFAQHSKGEVTVRQALTHRTGVPGFKQPRSVRQMGDWDWVVAQIAAEPPWFNEDTVCYHAHTFGFILGELIRRVTGKSLLDFLNEELIEPLDADFHLVLSDEKVRTRSFRMLNLKPQFDGENILGDQVFSSFDVPLHSDAWYAISQKAVVPSGGGFSCASGLNKIATMMAQKGTYRGKRYLSEVIVEEASSLQFSGVDPMLGEINLGLGFGLDGAAFPAPTQDSFHWGGYGGSWCFADHKRKLAGAYVTNHCIVNNFAAGTFDMRLVGFFGLMRTTFS